MGKITENKYVLYDDYAELIITSKKHGMCKVKIDKEDIARCRERHWCVNLIGGSWMYIVSTTTLLHRYIMNTDDKDMVVDHINGDTFDNRKSNLRICSNTDNCRNRDINKNNSSGIKGVFWYDHCVTPKWVAFIRVDRKRIHLGYFDELEDAIEARKSAEEKYFGEFRRLQ